MPPGTPFRPDFHESQSCSCWVTVDSAYKGVVLCRRRGSGYLSYPGVDHGYAMIAFSISFLLSLSPQVNTSDLRTLI
jgi:hypothetical protein